VLLDVNQEEKKGRRCEVCIFPMRTRSRGLMEGWCTALCYYVSYVMIYLICLGSMYQLEEKGRVIIENVVYSPKKF